MIFQCTKLPLSVLMLYYSVRDIGVIHEIEEFIDGFVPSQKTVTDVLANFPDFTESEEKASHFPLLASHEQNNAVFPMTIVAIVGHAGSGKTHILKHIANKRRTCFYAPTNAAGINLQSTLWPSMLFANDKKRVYKTIHSFYQIQPAESNVLGQCVQKMRQGHETSSCFDDYLLTMYKACKPFCRKLFAKDITSGKITPQQYQEHRINLCRKNGVSHVSHEDLIEYIFSLGLGNKLPNILLYDTIVLEEAGRTSDYIAFLFPFHYYFMHITYETYIWRQKIPTLIFVGSPTQSKVIDDFTPWSALTFLGQPCIKRHLNEMHFLKIKSFKDNRRVTTGNIDSNTTLASVTGKLELGLPIPLSLREKFNAQFVTSEENFFDPLYKPGYFRIAKKHEHLKNFKDNIFRQNEHNMVEIPEHFLTKEEQPFFSNLQGHINVKCRSEHFQEMWVNTKLKSKLFEEEFLVYKTSRNLLRGFRYLLTEYHSVYICHFSGSIQQFVEVTDQLQPYMLNDRSNCLSFFVNCAKFLIEDFYSDLSENVAKGLNDLVASCASDPKQVSLHHLFSLKTLLQYALSTDKYKAKIYTYTNEQFGCSVALPKDVFSFVLLDADIKRKQSNMSNVCLFLQFHECLTVKMYPKIKSISTSEVCENSQPQIFSKPNFQKFKRKRAEFEEEEKEQEDFDVLDTTRHMSEMLNLLVNKSFFSIMPLVLHICSTIDSTQGLTIHSPILALLKKEDRAEDIIVALSRTSNPDTLLVANKVFDQKCEPIAFDTRNLVKMINDAQRKDGWL